MTTREQDLRTVAEGTLRQFVTGVAAMLAAFDADGYIGEMADIEDAFPGFKAENSGHTFDVTKPMAYLDDRKVKGWIAYPDDLDGEGFFYEVENPRVADLMDYNTGQRIRDATADELRASIRAARSDGGAGVILVDDQGERSCYVV